MGEPGSTGPSADYATLKKLSTALAATYDVQPYFMFDGHFNDRKSIVRFLQDTAAFDSLFTFQQCNPKYVPDLLTELFGQIDEPELKRALGTDLSTIVAVARALLADQPQGPLIFAASDIATLASLELPDVTRALACLCHGAQPNARFLDPIGGDRPEFWKLPLLRLDEEFLLLDAAYCAPAFYEAVLATLRAAKVSQLDEKVGLAFEQVALKRLGEAGLKARTGHYDSSIGAGQCDAVVETPEAIVFLEFKKKCLTQRARSAQDDAILADLANAMLDPHSQTGRHELALISDQRLLLRNGTSTYTLELNARRVERVAISLLEFGAFHSREVSSQVLPSSVAEGRAGDLAQAA